MGGILVVAPHPDDECLGAGGTIAELSSGGGEVTVLTVGGHLPPLYPPEVHIAALDDARRAHGLLGVKRSVFLDLPAVLLSQHPFAEMNGMIQKVVDDVEPSTVFLPFPDRHVDHRTVFEAGMVATRPIRSGLGVSMVALYETLSETHWNAPGAEPTFAPNWTVDISASIDQKIEAMSQYRREVSPFPGPRSLDALRALGVFRGSQAGFAAGEAFQVVRATFHPILLNQGAGSRAGSGSTAE